MEKDAFVKFLTFLLGPLSSTESKNVSTHRSEHIVKLNVSTTVSSSLEYYSS